MNYGSPTFATRRKSDINKKEGKPSRALPKTSFLSSRSLRRKILHLPGTTPPEETLSQLLSYRNGGNHVEIAGTFL